MLKEVILANWIGTLKQKSTKVLYLTSVKRFLTTVYGGNTEKTDEEYEELANRFVAESKSERNWFDDLIAYAVTFKDRPPKLRCYTFMQLRNLLKTN